MTARARTPSRTRTVAAASVLLAVASLASCVALGGCGSDPTAASTNGDDASPGDDSSRDGSSSDDARGDAAAPTDAGEDARASILCPAGTTLRRAATSCPGAPLAPPAALVSSLATAAPGDVVSMAGMTEDDAPCLPVVVCTPSDAPSLLFSDSPESPAQDGVLYADSLAAGRYRFYVYHANGGTALRKFPVVALNSGAAPATITIVRRGLAAPSTAYVSVGKTVLLDWLTDRAPVSVVVPPGQRVLLDDALDQLHAAKDQLVHAIYDVVIDAPLKVSVVSVLAGADAATSTAGLSLLTRDVDHQRGTFEGAEVLVVSAPGSGSEAGAQKQGVQHLRLGADAVDDTLQGIDAPTGDKQTLLGNYGMLYRFALGLPAPARAAVAPRGGAWGGAARSGAAPSFALPGATEALGTTTDAIAVGDVGVGAPELRVMTGGGSNLPVDLFLVTP